MIMMIFKGATKLIHFAQLVKILKVDHSFRERQFLAYFIWLNVCYLSICSRAVLITSMKLFKVTAKMIFAEFLYIWIIAQ